MEIYGSPDKKPKEKESKNEHFILVKAAKMEPFKIEIFCKEYLDIMADIISNPGSKYNSMKEMIDGIKKPIVMKIDTAVHDSLKTIGDTNDIEMVCKYIAVQRIIGSIDDNVLSNMMSKVKEYIRELPVSVRHVITTAPNYQGIFALVPAAYLSSVCNLTSVNAEIAKMDKDNAQYMTKIMDALKEQTTVDPKDVSECHTVILDLVKRILMAYKENNVIDLANIRKDLNNMFDGDLAEYFQKMINQISKDIDDSFTAFTKLVREMNDTDSEKFSKDTPDPFEYDQVEELPLEPDPLGNDSVLGPDENYSPPPPPAEAMPPETPPPAGGVVTGLESTQPLGEGILGFRKRLRRINKGVIGYIKVRGLNARDADELTMYVSYGYSVAERCEWYMDIIEREDDRYIVPQSYQELSRIKDELYKVLDELTKKPFFRAKGSILRDGIDPY
jgi:hypothetical protein